MRTLKIQGMGYDIPSPDWRGQLTHREINDKRRWHEKYGRTGLTKWDLKYRCELPVIEDWDIPTKIDINEARFYFQNQMDLGTSFHVFGDYAR